MNRVADSTIADVRLEQRRFRLATRYRADARAVPARARARHRAAAAICGPGRHRWPGTGCRASTSGGTEEDAHRTDAVADGGRERRRVGGVQAEVDAEPEELAAIFGLERAAEIRRAAP